MNKFIFFLFFYIILANFSICAKGQSLFDIVKKKVNINANYKLGNTSNSVNNLNNNIKTVGNNSNNKIKSIEEIKETSNYKNLSFIDTNKYFMVSNDFFIDISGIKSRYPKGFSPKWGMIGNYYQINFEKINYLQSKLKGNSRASIGIGNINGAAYVYISDFLYPCNCAGKLLNNKDRVLITSDPQTFYVADFRKLSSNGAITSTPCKSMTGSYYETGGWKLKVIMNIDNNESLIVSTTVESITEQSNLIKNNGTNISSIWSITNTYLPNLMTPEKAIEIIRVKENAEKESKIRSTELAKKQKEDEIAFEAKIKNSFVEVVKEQSEFKNGFSSDCIKIEQGSYYVEGESHKVYGLMQYYTNYDGTQVPMGVDESDVSTPGETKYYSGLKNICDKPITIKGVTKLISNHGTIYYEDASFSISPGQITNSVYIIDDNYDPNKAEIGSTHYFKNKL